MRLVTHLGLIKPPCLPSPEAIGARFGKVLAEGFGGTSRWNMLLPALIRVFCARVTVISTGILIIGAVASTFDLGICTVMNSPLLDQPKREAAIKRMVASYGAAAPRTCFG